MEQMFNYRSACWVLGLLLVAPLASAQDEEETTNFGREAREGTPALWRDPDKPLDQRERIHHALSRLTFGVTNDTIYEVEQLGLDKWIEQQMEAGAQETDVLQDRLAKIESLTMSNQEIVQTYRVPIPPLRRNATPEERKRRAEARAKHEVPKNDLKDTVLLTAVYSKNQLREVACDFWRNHFNIDVSKGNVKFYATEYERDVIRAEALGTMYAMLNKQARHPAMLVYLDNYISRAAPQKTLIAAAQRALFSTRDFGAAMEAVDIAKMKGINENYARELMELHTLGVDNDYTQDDVIAVANILTGWTVQQNPNEPIVFEFRKDMHGSEPRLLLGKRVPSIPRDPEREGQLVLNMLVAHEGTSKFIAYKLCRHLVSDTPSEEMVERLAKVYMRKKSNLPELYKALLADEEFYNPKNYQSKFKRPFEFVVSALRVTGAEIESTGGIHQALVSMSEPIYQCEDPTGYYDQADAWRDPGVMAPRWRFALGLGLEQIRGVRIPDSYWEGLKPDNPVQWMDVLTQRILPGGHTEKTSEALETVVAKYARTNPKPEQLGRYIVGILLGSPEFQRQ
ncbi:MAG TPA: DUF1800 domain-containing protein [Pirellulaceae bacterium]|jgi:uncharacterized protein (DUF1800 family)|nr:DUF1800 domain-containing protein [Pirellulaceae bacterium]